MRHPYYGAGTYLSSLRLGGRTTAGVAWDVCPPGLAPLPRLGYACGCDQADLRPLPQPEHRPDL